MHEAIRNQENGSEERNQTNSSILVIIRGSSLKERDLNYKHKPNDSREPERLEGTEHNHIKVPEDPYEWEVVEWGVAEEIKALMEVTLMA